MNLRGSPGAVTTSARTSTIWRCTLFGVIFASQDGHVGLSWLYVGRSWLYVGRSWLYVGHLDPILAQLSANLASSCLNLPRLSSILSNSGLILTPSSAQKP